ncbi:hypothetical protein [Terriglobus sp. TAA 43]|nr:hypothetical protein [Terriglobus sp. TAA 43]
MQVLDDFGVASRGFCETREMDGGHAANLISTNFVSMRASALLLSIE